MFVRVKQGYDVDRVLAKDAAYLQSTLYKDGNKTSHCFIREAVVQTYTYLYQQHKTGGTYVRNECTEVP